jgi:hypothetical protein
MVNVTKPNILTSVNLQTKAGKVKCAEERYNLSKKVQSKDIKKDESTKSVEKLIHGMVMEKGAIVVSVSYWMERCTQPIQLH